MNAVLARDARIRDQDGAARREGLPFLPFFSFSLSFSLVFFLLLFAGDAGWLLCVDPAAERRRARKIRRSAQVTASREQDGTKPRAIILIF